MPGFEPWRPVLATARVVEDAGVTGLVARIGAQARAYQAERAAPSDLEVPDATRLAVLAVAELADIRTLVDVMDINSETPQWWEASVRFTARDVTERVNAEARSLGLTDDTTDFTTAARIGRILKTLRVKVARDSGKKRTREREITRRAAYTLLRAYVPALTDLSEVRRGEAHPPDDPSQLTSITSINVQTSRPRTRETIRRRMPSPPRPSPKIGRVPACGWVVSRGEPG